MKKKWDELTKEGREAYINQDQVKQPWQETLACCLGHDVFEAIADRIGAADMQDD